MKEVVLEGREADFGKPYMKFCDAEEFEYKGQIIPAEIAKNIVMCKQMEGVSPERKWEIALNVASKGLNITPYSAAKIAKAEHEGKADQMLTYYKRKGFLKCKAGSEETKSELARLFSEKFKGRVPQIVQELADASDYFGIPTADIVGSFRVDQVAPLRKVGLSGVQIAILMVTMDDKQLSCLSDNLEFAEMASDLSARGIKTGDRNLNFAALWVANHTESDPKVIKKIVKNVSDIDFAKNPTLSELITKKHEGKYSSEVKKIEKAYKKCGFKLSECKCLLKKGEVTDGRYTAKILDGDDPMQVILGKAEMGGVACCQHLGDAGESSMMFGLSNDHAGFFVITETKTGAIKAQAEVWEENEHTLVFDNIEFANDADISLYKGILKKWLEESEYRSVAMGNGYNALAYKNGFDTAPNFTPHVTAKDLYVLSYEDDADPAFRDHHEASDEEWDRYMELKSPEKAQKLMDKGEIDYYTYLYSDVDDGKGLKWLKEDGVLARYFADDFEPNRNEEREERSEEDYDEDYEEEYDDEY